MTEEQEVTLSRTRLTMFKHWGMYVVIPIAAWDYMSDAEWEEYGEEEAQQ